jgi:hypothetical protein
MKQQMFSSSPIILSKSSEEVEDKEIEAKEPFKEVTTKLLVSSMYFFHSLNQYILDNKYITDQQDIGVRNQSENHQADIIQLTDISE